MGELVSVVFVVYLAVGVLVATLFWSGVLAHRDPVYTSSSKRVRLVLVPGFVVLWPIVLNQRAERSGSGS